MARRYFSRRLCLGLSDGHKREREQGERSCFAAQCDDQPSRDEPEVSYVSAAVAEDVYLLGGALDEM